MGERGMADMGEMEMALPDNTLPMMTGQGPYGAMEMGGMFTMVKVRARPRARRLQGPRLVRAAAGNAGLRMDRHPARADARRGAAAASEREGPRRQERRAPWALTCGASRPSP